MNLAVLSYGVATVAIASGAFMAIMGIALGMTGVGAVRISPQNTSDLKRWNLESILARCQ